MIDPDRATRLIADFGQHRVLVVGDLILDRYLWGNTERISPEAPVPVVHVDRESTMLGGAGNVARNLASLGASVEVVGVIGEDDAALEIRRLCERWKIGARRLVSDGSRPTTEKTRIIARAQQVVRFDRETELRIAPALVERVLDAIRTAASEVQLVILEDYAKGLLGPAVISEAMDILRASGVAVFVDPKDPPWEIYRGAELIKPNQREAEQVVGFRVRSDADLERLGRQVLELSGVHNLALTRGGDGMSMFATDEPTRHIPTAAQAVADVAGAGDTVIAALALGRLSGATWQEAAEIANAAAGVVVAVSGTATLTPGQLRQALGASR
ncbi:MAG: D-glycero-beta-D-manno-heptose-7-phosphate kinase [bacterium]|nr:D-glycero-beta-D-manno-heptose-7-phosphate kinase [bacterium]